MPKKTDIEVIQVEDKKIDTTESSTMVDDQMDVQEYEDDFEVSIFEVTKYGKIHKKIWSLCDDLLVFQI